MLEIESIHDKHYIKHKYTGLYYEWCFNTKSEARYKKGKLVIEMSRSESQYLRDYFVAILENCLTLLEK